jgi:hypothetical protein
MWVVKLSGNTSDLSTLAQCSDGSTTRILQEEQNYSLRSDEFLVGDDAETVFMKASGIVEVLKGATILLLGAVCSIRVASVEFLHEDGKRDITLFAETIKLRLSASAVTMKVTRNDGKNEAWHPVIPVDRLVHLASQNKAVALVFRLLADKPLDWINLYRILEIVESDVGGLCVIDKKKWASEKTIKRFKHTANSPEASGLEARHGSQTTQPPKNPMKISDAQSLVKSIVQAWLLAGSQ